MADTPKTGPWTGKPLRRLRKLAGLSQGDLADLVQTYPGCSKVIQPCVSTWERGGEPGATKFYAIKMVLGVTDEELLANEP